MKMSIITAALSAVAAPMLIAAEHTKGAVVYVFDADYAGGVDGTIQTVWDESIACDRVKVKAELEFKRVDLKALAKADGNCTGPVKEYTYHIHTKWNQPSNVTSSTSYAQCAKAITGNHYDPNKACGPASEYADTPECAPKIKDYKCTPERYYDDVSNCEFGDLSGKLGTLKPDEKGVVKAEWTDSLFPSWNDHKPTWNIVIHAVCGKATPRVACAVGQQFGPKRKHFKGSKYGGHDHEEEDDAGDAKDANEDDYNEDDEDDRDRDYNDDGVEGAYDATDEANDTEDDVENGEEGDDKELVIKLYLDDAM